VPIDEPYRTRSRRFARFEYAELLAGGPAVAAAIRAYAAPVAGYRAPAVDVREALVDGPHGAVRVRVYAPPARAGGGPGLVWVHGGGFRAGDLDMPEADAVGRELCARAGAAVVSVEYRLAVDGVTFPVPHDDVMAAWRWAAASTGELGVRDGGLALGGASAGANLAVGVALRARDEHTAAPARLVLAYPLLHRALPPPAAPLPADVEALPASLRLTPRAVAAMNAAYLGAADPSPYAFPGDGPCHDLPPTVMLTSEYDDLRSSGEAFATALARAGIDVRIRCERGAPHGHLNVPGADAFTRSVEWMAAGLA
jgi:acetyl esterase/lipase